MQGANDFAIFPVERIKLLGLCNGLIEDNLSEAIGLLCGC
jgi:hypothetical protein